MEWTIQIDGLMVATDKWTFKSFTEHTLRFTVQGLSRLDITRRYRGGPVPWGGGEDTPDAWLGSGTGLTEQYFFTSREILLQSILEKREKGT